MKFDEAPTQQCHCVPCLKSFLASIAGTGKVVPLIEDSKEQL